MGDLTDIQAGLKVAESLLENSTQAKKYIVLLTDGLPNTDTNGNVGEFSDATLNSTVSELQGLASKNINLVSLLIGVTNDNYINPTISPQSYQSGSYTYESLANEIFGKSDSPKYGPVYYVNTEGVTDAITNTLYKDLMPDTHTIEVDDTETYKLTDVVIKDYFPDYIVKNFNFSMLVNPTKGNLVSPTIDEADNSITWVIPELAPQEIATLTYRLTLKDNVDVSILDKDLKTNKDVTIDYKEGGVQKEQVHNDKSPVVKLVVPSPTPTPTPAPTPTPVPKDDTVAPKPIPQTGSYTWIAIGGFSILGIATSIFGIIKYLGLK